MSDNPKEQGVWNVPVLLETIERNRRERDEARRWARKLYAENQEMKQAVKGVVGASTGMLRINLELSAENARLHRELEKLSKQDADDQ